MYKLYLLQTLIDEHLMVWMHQENKFKCKQKVIFVCRLIAHQKSKLHSTLSTIIFDQIDDSCLSSHLGGKKMSASKTNFYLDIDKSILHQFTPVSFSTSI